VSLFWLGREPMVRGKEYSLKLGTAKVGVKLEEVKLVLDASTLERVHKDKIERYDVAECVLKTDKPIAFDLAHEINQTSRFVIVDNYQIAGGGIIHEALRDERSKIRDMVLLRNMKWIKSKISPTERAEKYNQKPSLILITGKEGMGRKDIARALEKKLFDDGKFVYYLGIGSIIYGVDADIDPKDKMKYRAEHLRRTAEVAYIMLESGMILIVTAIELNQDDLEIIKTVIDPEKILTVWVGEDITTDISYDIHISDYGKVEEAMNMIKSELQDRGIIFKPW